MIYNGEEFYESKRYDIDPIIDRVGGGDSFSGGVIHGLRQADAGRGPEFARGGIGPEAHDQRRLQPRIGRGGRVVGRR